jgi:hypothetical protein
MDVVREITEFYYRKGARGLLVSSLPGGMEEPYAGKRKNFTLSQFYTILNFEVGRKPPSSMA